MKKNYCIFCNYPDKKVIIYRGNLCYAVISHNPINKYYVLVIPQEHYKHFIDLPDKIVSHLFIVAKKLSEAVRKACKPDAIEHISDDDISNIGINLVRNHYKFHIIPRFKNDNIRHYWNLRGDKGIKVRSKYAKEIKKYILK